MNPGEPVVLSGCAGIGLLCWPAANPSLCSGPPLLGILHPAGWCPCGARKDGAGVHREPFGKLRAGQGASMPADSWAATRWRALIRGGLQAVPAIREAFMPLKQSHLIGGLAEGYP